MAVTNKITVRNKTNISIWNSNFRWKFFYTTGIYQRSYFRKLYRYSTLYCAMNNIFATQYQWSSKIFHHMPLLQNIFLRFWWAIKISSLLSVMHLSSQYWWFNFCIIKVTMTIMNREHDPDTYFTKYWIKEKFFFF